MRSTRDPIRMIGTCTARKEKYLGFVFDRARQVIEPRLGDVMVFRYGRCYAHGGIVTEIKPLKIDAFQQARMVIEEEVARNPVLSERRRSPKFFSYWAGA